MVISMQLNHYSSSQRTLQRRKWLFKATNEPFLTRFDLKISNDNFWFLIKKITLTGATPYQVEIFHLKMTKKI